MYKKTSLSELAQELGVSKSALYRHFKSKETLADAMAASFLDDFAASVRDDFQQALKSKDADKGIFTIIRSIAGYFARNAYALIFSLVNIYDRNLDDYMINEHLEKRGADMKTLLAVIEKKYDCDLTLLKLIFATLIFFMSHFHKTNNSFENVPSEKDIENIISTIYEITEHGLGYTRTNARARVHEKELSLDFEKLEKQVEGILQIAEPEPLFKAVAEAVAEAGPWDASMEMVAKRAGFSKSSLYGHFKNRTDMLRRLFKLEFTRIIEFARQAITLSENNTAEQLYLGIYSIAVYLRSRPEILISLGWIRTRKLDLGKPDNTEIFRLFEDVKIEGA